MNLLSINKEFYHFYQINFCFYDLYFNSKCFNGSPQVTGPGKESDFLSKGVQKINPDLHISCGRLNFLWLFSVHHMTGYIYDICVMRPGPPISYIIFQPTIPYNFATNLLIY